MILAVVVVFFACIRCFVTLYNIITQPVLPYYPEEINPVQEVSILIPVRNEEENLKQLLESILNADRCHPLIKEIIILNDRSTDDTRSVYELYKPRLPFLQWKEGLPLPVGWAGKNWACHQLSILATGDFILFIDADVIVTENLLPNASQRMRKYNLDLLSLFPDQKMVTFPEKLVVPLMHYFLLTSLPLRMVRTLGFSSLAAANGQFMFYKTDSYRKINFHERLKNNVLEDVNSMRMLKKYGLQGEVLLANQQIWCRMYKTWNEALQGFSKNFYLGFDKKIVPYIIFFVTTLIGGLIVVCSLNSLLICLYGMIWLSMSAMVAMLCKQPILKYLILQPVRAIIFMIVAVNSCYIHTTNKVLWKGRKIVL